MLDKLLKPTMKVFYWKHGDVQTIGQLEILRPKGIPFTCKILCPPWRFPNKPSCIAPGVSRIEPYLSPTKGRTLLLLDTPGFTMVEFHIGNFFKDTTACFCPGLTFRDINADGHVDVTSSKIAMDRILGIITEQTTIEIVGVHGFNYGG